jgi:hypothetical protein
MFQKLCYPQMVNKKVMQALFRIAGLGFVQLSIHGKAY